MAQTLPNGVVVPNADGGEQISATGVAEMRTLGATADAAIADARFTKTNPGPFDFDTMKTPGTYSFGSPFPDGWTNVPEGITGPSILNVYGSPSLSWCAQELIQYGRDQKRMWRISETTLAWGPWQEIETAEQAMAANEARKSEMIAATGGAVDTGGKAAFALRIDHGYNNYKTKLRAGLLSRGIVPGIATNSRNWGLAENNAVTLTEVDGWVAAGDIEILNHGATHGKSQANLHDEIVNGKTELETQLPAARIWGFAPPGDSEWWGDFQGGKVGGWGAPPAGLILANHAYSLGYVGGARRVLDGTIRQALSHITLDKYDMTQARAQVDAAIAEGRGIQVMLHADWLDTTGNLTTADLFAFLDYVVAKQDAGELVILSPDQLILADSTRAPDLSAQLAALTYRSGRRNITGLLDPAPASGALYIERRGDTVWLNVDGLTYDQTIASITFYNVITDGFRSTEPADLSSSPRTEGEQQGNFRTYNHVFVMYRLAAGAAARGLVSWPTNQAIPTTLPGTPA